MVLETLLALSPLAISIVLMVMVLKKTYTKPKAQVIKIETFKNRRNRR